VLVLLDGVVALRSQDEVSGDELRALVEKLVERVLCVGGGLAEYDGTSGVLDVVAAAGDGLSVRLHGQLLEVGGEAVQVLVETSSLLARALSFPIITYGETRWVWAPKKSEYHTLRRPPITGMFFSRGVSLKCLSMAWAPARSWWKLSKPM
jgi:hypothetical protein